MESDRNRGKMDGHSRDGKCFGVVLKSVTPSIYVPPRLERVPNTAHTQSIVKPLNNICLLLQLHNSSHSN